MGKIIEFDEASKTNKGYERGQEVCFLRDGKRVKGNIKEFLTKEEAKTCKLWYIPLMVELKDKTTIEIAEHELI